MANIRQVVKATTVFLDLQCRLLMLIILRVRNYYM